MGLAPEARILPIRVNLEGNRLRGRDSLCLDNGASIINISMILQDSQYKDGASAEDLEFVAYALDEDVLIVAGAGNDGEGGDLPFPAGTLGVVAAERCAKRT